MNKISLTASMRSNLLSLQNISRQVDSTQNKLSTGNKVNSAIDNPSSYYAARSLNNRAGDLDALLDSMGQAVSTIKAATTALETGASFLEQAAAVATIALEGKGISGTGEGQETGQTDVLGTAKTNEQLAAEGYTVVTNAADLQTALTNGGKVALGGDITLTAELQISKNVILDGNGHNLSFSPSAKRQAAIKIDGADASADIKNLSIKASGYRVYGIRVANGGSLVIDNTMGIQVSGTGAQRLVNGDTDLYDGQTNTAAMKEASTTDSRFDIPVADVTTDYFVTEADKGSWYMPSMGELMELYGTDITAITAAEGTSGANRNNLDKINATIRAINAQKPGTASEMKTDGNYWSSTEGGTAGSWMFNMSNGSRSLNYVKSRNEYVRSFQLLQNLFDPLSASGNTVPPKIGDIVYADKTYGSAETYDSSKIAMGIVAAVSEDERDVKIVALNDASDSGVAWGAYGFDIEDVWSYTNTSTFFNAVKNHGTISVRNVPFTANSGVSGGGDDTDDASIYDSSQYQSILSQYDSLIKDASYKGVNLLQQQDLKVTFNESRTSSLNVVGKDASSAALGLTTTEWESIQDIAQSLKEISSALNKIRSMSSELGSYYNIVTTRQDFTENLINVLEEGADKLTLADMNEESANMLALQTRQQLAVNSLSLASQAAQSILKLF